MVIDLAAYRRSRAKPRVIACDLDEELICVNWEPARVLQVRAVAPVAPLASPELPEIDANLAAFDALAHALATQI